MEFVRASGETHIGSGQGAGVTNGGSGGGSGNECGIGARGAVIEGANQAPTQAVVSEREGGSADTTHADGGAVAETKGATTANGRTQRNWRRLGAVHTHIGGGQRVVDACGRRRHEML